MRLALLLFVLFAAPNFALAARLHRDQRREMRALEELLPELLRRTVLSEPWCDDSRLESEVKQVLDRAHRLEADCGRVELRPAQAERMHGDGGIVELRKRLAADSFACSLRRIATTLVAEADEGAHTDPVRAAEALEEAGGAWSQGDGHGTPPGFQAACDRVWDALYTLPEGLWQSASEGDLQARLDGGARLAGTCPPPAKSAVKALKDSLTTLRVLARADAAVGSDPHGGERTLREAIWTWPRRSVWGADTAIGPLRQLVEAVDASLAVDLRRLEESDDPAGLDEARWLRALETRLRGVSALRRADTEAQATVGLLEARLEAFQSRRAESQAERKRAEAARKQAMDRFLGKPELTIDGRYFCGRSGSGVLPGSLGAEEVRGLIEPLLDQLRDAGLRNVRAALTGAFTRVDGRACPQILAIEAELTTCGVERLFESGAYPSARGGYYGQIYDRGLLDAVVTPVRLGIFAAEYSIALRNRRGAALEMSFTWSARKLYNRLDGALLNREGTILMPVEYVAPVAAFLQQVRDCP
jgi:hypothetical protein